MTPKKLRPDLANIENDDGSTRFDDPLTKRRFAFDAMQGEVLKMLDGTRSSADIAEELFGDSSQTGAIDLLVERADGLGLLNDGPPLDVYALRVKQAAAMRDGASKARDRRTAASVRWAQSHLPFYRDRLAGIVDQVDGVADLPKLPCTTKADVRANFPARLIADSLDLETLIENGDVGLETTSGSTGGRLQFIYDRQQKVPATLELTSGFAERQRVTFTTPICSGQVCHRGGVPYEERLFGPTLLILNSTERIMLLEREHLEEILRECELHNATEMTVDPVYGAALVRGLEKFDLPVPKMKGITSGFEFLTHRHRHIIEGAFGLPLGNLLGATDLGGPITLSCENNRMHVLNHVVLEFLRDGKPVGYGEVGEITVTIVGNNPYTRLVRYRVGDLGRPIESCGCVWDDWPCFEIEGKIKDTLFATDGTCRTSRAIDDLFMDLTWLDFYQLTQRSPNEFDLAGVRWQGTETNPDESEFKRRFRALMGSDSTLKIRYVRELPIEQSFKFPQTKQKSRDPLLEW